jgi:hypothetical protein
MDPADLDFDFLKSLPPPPSASVPELEAWSSGSVTAVHPNRAGSDSVDSPPTAIGRSAPALQSMLATAAASDVDTVVNSLQHALGDDGFDQDPFVEIRYPSYWLRLFFFFT